MPQSKTDTPSRVWSLIGVAIELGVWGALAFLIIARRNFSPLPIIGLVAALILARLGLNLWHNGKIRFDGPLALLFPSALRWPLRLWAILLAISFYLTFQYDLAVPRLSMFVMGFVTLGSLYNMTQLSRRGAGWLWTIALGWLLLATAIASGGALTASWVFLKVSLLQRLYPGYEVQVVQLANDQTTNVNILAGVVSPIIMPPIGMALGLIWHSSDGLVNHWLRRLLILSFIVLAIFLTGLMLLTQSFGGYGALAAGVAVFAALRYRKIGWLLAVVVALGVVGALLYLPTLMALSPAELDVLLRKRYFIWLRAVTMIADMPFSGIGLGMFPYASRLMFANMISSITDQPPHAHNLLLELGLDFGIVGMACFVALQVLLWRIGLRAINATPASADAWALRGLLAGQAMWLVFNLTDLAYPGTRASFIYWGAWALILAFAQAQSRKTTVVASA
ncbi:MAG: O-antigen ligase family protein [Anaerolineae bacterium]|nr:O-antigen ligase family protein [Anaerolineae bacterium]